MATNFPLSASIGQNFNGYTFNGTSWEIDGEHWKPITYAPTEPDYTEPGFIWVDSNQPAGEENDARQAYVSSGSAWAPLISAVPNMAGYATTDYVDTEIANIDALPSQTGNDGKFLTTDGSLASWADVDLSPYLTIDSASNTYLTQLDAQEQYEKLIPFSSASPSGAVTGDIWIDSSSGSLSPALKTYNGTDWVQLGGSDNVFMRLNLQTIDSDYTIPSGYNGVTAGPITIADGVTVTIPDGSSWSVV